MGEDFGAEQTAAIERVSTGSFELDSILSGGLPRGSLILISGNPGTGKTTLTSGFLYAGAKDGSENGIYVSFCEGKKSFYENQMTLGLDFAKLEKEGHFRFMEMFTTTKEGMGAITGDILRGIKEFGAKRLVVDSYTVMTQALGGVYEGRQVLHTILGKIVRTMGCTTLVIGEQPTGETRIGDGAEEFVADGVLNLKLSIPRELEIRKMRGTRLTTRNMIYTIDHGFQVLRTDHQVDRVNFIVLHQHRRLFGGSEFFIKRLGLVLPELHLWWSVGYEQQHFGGPFSERLFAGHFNRFQAALRLIAAAH